MDEINQNSVKTMRQNIGTFYKFCPACVFTIDGDLNLSGGVAGSIGSRADELSSLISRGRGDEQAAIRIQGKGWTTQVQQLPTLQNISHRVKGRGQSSIH